MKTLLIIILTLTTIAASAQNNLIGITGGANWTNVTSSNFLNNTDYRHGVSAGINYEYFIKERFSIGSDVIYIQRGFTDDVIMPNGGEATTKYDYNYLAVPVKTGFYNGRNKIFDFVKVGLIPSLLIDAKTSTPTFATEEITNRVSKFDLAGLIEIGGGFKIVDKLWLTTSFIYQHSLTTITNSEYFANSKIRHNGMSLNIGLKWALKNE